MASFTVRVNMSKEELEDCACNAPQVRDAVTKAANEIAERANNMGEPSGLWYDVGAEHHPEREGGTWQGNRKGYETYGNTPALYAAKPAKMSKRGRVVAIVTTENYAAKRDNMKNNTLVKAIG